MTGVVMGMLLGGVLSYLYASPEGKKKAKEFIEESVDVLQDLSKQAQDMGAKANQLKESLSKQVQEINSEDHDEAESLGAQISQRFFKKRGKKLS